MNLKNLSDKMMIRELCSKNETIETFINECNTNNIELLSLFNLKYNLINQYQIITFPAKFKVYEIIINSLIINLSQNPFENKLPESSIYIGNSTNLAFIGNKIINDKNYFAFILLSSDIVFLIHECILDTFLNEITSPLQQNLFNNDFKKMKNELESISNDLTFFTIEK